MTPRAPGADADEDALFSQSSSGPAVSIWVEVREVSSLSSATLVPLWLSVRCAGGYLDQELHCYPPLTSLNGVSTRHLAAGVETPVFFTPLG
jgi:hypothetical protein